jgi:hypothetical protein
MACSRLVFCCFLAAAVVIDEANDGKYWGALRWLSVALTAVILVSALATTAPAYRRAER